MAKKKARQQPDTTGAAQSREAAAECLRDYIEDERLRLMRATAVLDVMRIAMEEKDAGTEVDIPCYSDVARVARDLVNKSINNLDSVAIGPLYSAIAADAAK